MTSLMIGTEFMAMTELAGSVVSSWCVIHSWEMYILSLFCNTCLGEFVGLPISRLTCIQLESDRAMNHILLLCHNPLLGETKWER